MATSCFIMFRQLLTIHSIISAQKERTVGVGDQEEYKHKNAIPSCTDELIKPIHKDLSNPDLLNKFTQGLIQNVNECLNGRIWERCLKSVYVEQQTVALTTYLAILKFNYGDVSFLKLLSDLDITLGIIACKGAEDADDSRIKMSAKKSTEKVKKKRKELKHQRKQYCYTGLAELTL